MTGAFRCAAASLARDEPLGATASTVRSFLLVENPGPWGVDALRDARLPTEVRTGLAEAARAAGVRVLMVRRHHRSAPRAGFRVFAAYADPAAPWLETTVLDTSGDLLEVDVAAVGSGASPGWERSAETLLCVCTHGRHDACCAERGRPVAAALTAAHPEETWEVSHIGGDRFAGNLLVLPHGLYYGRLDPPAALAVADGQLAGHLDLDHLRGRSGYPMSVQAAELALRRALGEARDASVGPATTRREGEQVVAGFRVGGAVWEVAVARGPSAAPRQLTCKAQRENAAPGWEVLGISRVG